MTRPTLDVAGEDRLRAAANALVASGPGLDAETAARAVRAAVDPHAQPARCGSRYARLAELLSARPGLLRSGRYPEGGDPAPARTTVADLVRLVEHLREHEGLPLQPLRRFCPAGHPLRHAHWAHAGRGCGTCAELEAADAAATALATAAQLPVGQAREAVRAAVERAGAASGRRARYQRLERVLLEHPGLLACGSWPVSWPGGGAGTQVLSDLAAVTIHLHAAGHPSVIPLLRRCPEGHQLADDRARRQPCLACAHEHALAAATRAVTAALPALAPATATAALQAIAPTDAAARMVPARLRALAATLAEDPELLTGGASRAPLDVHRLIDALADAGVEAVVRPVCADCGQSGFLRHNRDDGQRICVGCHVRRRDRPPCSRCGKPRLISGRDEQGRPVCDPCWYADPAHQRPCGVCGRLARARLRVGDTIIGTCCYRHPQERCSVCGIRPAVNPYASTKATCAECAQTTLAVCTHCGLDAPPAPDDGEATCLRCATGATAACARCGALTVMRHQDTPCCWRCYPRPKRPCGRCGRTAVIARGATSDEPDLCGNCWRGPITTCDGCGRRRPCLGQRAGRMLCPGCQPRPKRPCGYCGHRRTVAAEWAEGPVCTQCYRAWMRGKGDCPRCGRHRRLLPYPGFDEPLCSVCAGADPGPVCGECGNEDWLYHKHRCARCVLTHQLADLLGDIDQRRALGLQPLFDTIAATERPESALGWLRPGRPAARLLAGLGSGELPLDHEHLDALAHAGTAANQLQATLTAIGALPARDPGLARLDYQLRAFLDGIDDADRQRLLRHYARWHLLRRARATSHDGAGLTPGQRNAATRALRAAARLLDWLATDGHQLRDLNQPRLEEYLLAFPAQRGPLAGFLRWARQQRHIPRLDLTRPTRPITVVPVDQDTRWDLARSLLHRDEHPLGHRIAALLVLLFAQTSTRIAALTTDDLTLTDQHVMLRLGATPIQIPEPFAGHLREFTATRASPGRLATQPGPWLFPGRHPGRPADSHTIRRRVRACGVHDVHTHRASALIDLAGQVPAPVLADLLGIATATAVHWSQLAGRPWGQYLGLPPTPTR